MRRLHRRLSANVGVGVNVCIETWDVRTGRLLRRQWKHNLVTDAGLTMNRDRMLGIADQLPVPLSHCAVGTDATAAAAGDTALGDEVFRDVFAQTVTGSKLVTYKVVIGSQQANGNVLREWGLFNAAAEGICYARVTPEEVAKSVDVQVIATWTSSWAAA